MNDARRAAKAYGAVLGLTLAFLALLEACLLLTTGASAVASSGAAEVRVAHTYDGTTQLSTGPLSPLAGTRSAHASSFTSAVTTAQRTRPKAATGFAAEAGSGETTTLWRAVGQHEADDIAAAGGYRNAPGLEGKYFFPTRAQAEQYGQMMNKAPGFGAPNYLTSGSVPTSALSSAEAMEAGSEGAGLFVRGDLNQFFDVFNHGLIP